MTLETGVGLQKECGMPNIVIKDQPCGSGKTSAMINTLQRNKKYLIVVPFLDEIRRIQEESKVTFKTPDNQTHSTKHNHLEELLLEGANIVITHALFERMRSLFLKGYLDNYHIIIDEVPNIVQAVNGPKRTSLEDIYIDGGYLYKDKMGLITPARKWTDNEEDINDTLSTVLLRKSQTGSLYIEGESNLIWAMPKELFTYGLSVTILTFLSEYSPFCMYLKKQGIPYTIERSSNLETKFKQNAQSNLTLMNSGPLKTMNLSYSAQKRGINIKSYTTKIQNSLKNLRSRQLKGIPPENILITCLKDGWFDKEKSGSFRKNSKLSRAQWIPNTTRGTNLYRHCSHLIYMYEQNLNPSVSRWLGIKDKKKCNDAYALSELIQWVWRSRIRDQKSIELCLPSKRMKNLLFDWLGSHQ